MLTPIGNPQNLYLFGKSGMNIGEFIALMLPYSLASLVLLVVMRIVPDAALLGLWAVLTSAY